MSKITIANRMHMKSTNRCVHHTHKMVFELPSKYIHSYVYMQQQQQHQQHLYNCITTHCVILLFLLFLFNIQTKNQLLCRVQRVLLLRFYSDSNTQTPNFVAKFFFRTHIRFCVNSKRKKPTR